MQAARIFCQLKRAVPRAREKLCRVMVDQGKLIPGLEGIGESPARDDFVKVGNRRAVVEYRCLAFQGSAFAADFKVRRAPFNLCGHGRCP